MKIIVKIRLFILKIVMGWLIKDAGILSYPMRVELELVQWKKYEKMAASTTYIDLVREMAMDARKFLKEAKRKLSIEQMELEEKEDRLYLKLLSERQYTEKGIVAACFKIPWSRLEQHEKGVVDTETKDAFIVRDGLILKHTHADGTNSKYFTDLLGDFTRENEEFVTEMPKRNFFIIGSVF